jgi:hypothetical protein
MGAARQRWVVALAAAAITVGFGGVAAAGVSDGNYEPERQGCTGHADDADAPDRVEEGCQNASVSVRDGNGDEAVRVGTQQTADGDQVDPTPTVATGEIDPATGVFVYFGADDNLANGEHDSSSAIGDGPSDGGAIVLDLDPSSLDRWLAALEAGDSQYLLTHPVPVLGAGLGGCADGVCFSAQTERRVAYQGGRVDEDGNPEGERDVADYEGKEWDPESCAGPSDTEEDCGEGGIATWHEKEGTVYVEPGVQVYEDPNPAGSPIGPYPVPAVYAGTCGVTLGGGPMLTAPASPVTNTAGQVRVETGC